MNTPVATSAKERLQNATLINRLYNDFERGLGTDAAQVFCEYCLDYFNAHPSATDRECIMAFAIASELHIEVK